VLRSISALPEGTAQALAGELIVHACLTGGRSICSVVRALAIMRRKPWGLFVC